MKIRSDLKKHAMLCAVAALCVLPLLWLAERVGLWAACLAAGVSLAVAYELLQLYRGEGEPSWQDALAGSIGAAAVAGLVALAGQVAPLPGKPPPAVGLVLVSAQLDPRT